MDCVFVKLRRARSRAKAYEDDRILAFYDLDPQAPVHILLIPKEHIESAADITEENSAIVAHIFAVAAKLAKELDLVQGWRVVTNVGKDGGQTVMHMHFHLLGGRSMAWPPG